MEADLDPTDRLVIDDELWDQLIELTDGAAAACFQCGVCTARCPWGLVREKMFSVRTLVRKAQLGLLDHLEPLWACTACAECEAFCPRGVPVADVIRGLRYLLWERRSTPEGLSAVLWSMFWNNNPWFQPPSKRSQWAADLDLAEYDPDRHPTLLYIGCTSSYDRRPQNIARSLVTILQEARMPFGTLGDDEPCCGEAALSLGHIPYFQEVAENTAQFFQDRQVSKLVTVSPHCYDVFRNRYPHADNLSPQHYTQLLSDLVKAERIQFKRALPWKVTYQDPCFLGRWNQEYEAPRRVLAEIPELSLVEMEHHGPEALCCGGGGGRMWMETPLGERFSDLRIQEAMGSEAEVIATSCPFCVSCLEDSLKAQNVEGMKVMDVAEIALLSLAEES